jgi:hypothetical protein
MTRPPRFHFVPTETRPITQPYRQQKEVRSVPPGPKSDVALAIRDAALDPAIIKGRQELAAFTGSTFNTVGIELQVFGHLLGPDRKSGASPFGHGNDAAVAVAMLLQIGSQLISGGAELIGGGRHYAGAALIRQLVEIEYLAWAFEAKNDVAAQWLRSDHKERQSFFTPAKLRKAAENRFRSVDYGHHCELGGHPTPRSWQLLGEDQAISQLMLSDALGHTGRIWDHIVGWSKGYMLTDIVESRQADMLGRYTSWKSDDPLTALPPPPA